MAQADHVPNGKRTLAVALACHNRRPLTLRCLQGLHAQAADFNLRIFLFDDGSSDGTGDAVRAAFPDVTIIEGDGHAFWGGGMYRAISAALDTDFNDLLWLNDDVALYPDALQRLIDAQAGADAQFGPGSSLIVGATREPGSDSISYAGFRRRSRLSPVWLQRVEPTPGALTPCDTMHGNVVLVPAAAARAIGPNDPKLIHELGDLDYGYRAGKAGYKILIAPQAVGECASNPRSRKSTPPGTLRQRWKQLNTPHGLPIGPWRHFMWRHGGMLGMAELGTIYFKRLTGW
ncbi:glycosyltransferase family 2 protein [Sphingobium aquiterrae]|uniref:glycosyltransferase family 2 protein n=1 Tax=Sphingobium aquiterrae TaxID=2038656 RepID=UPI003015F498